METGSGAGEPLVSFVVRRDTFFTTKSTPARVRAGIIVGLADSARLWAASGRTAREAHEALRALRRRNEDFDRITG